MKINYLNAIIAGVIGTLLFDIVGLLFTGDWWDIPGVLAQAVGLPFPVALLMHYGNGVALAVIYAALAPSLFGPAWFRGLLFSTVETLVLVWFLLFPLLGLGIGGFGGGLLFPILSMVRHWAYAIPLIYLLPVKKDSTKTEFDQEDEAVLHAIPLAGHEFRSSSSFLGHYPTDRSVCPPENQP